MKIKLFTIPNFLTLGNLLCGSFAAVSALVYNDLATAFFLVVAAVVFDFLDGFVARLLKCASPMGVELDSLADMVTSGFVPAAVLYAMYADAPQVGDWSEGVITVGGYALFVVTAFAALRLAKFNIDDTQHTEFCGLPSPANALFLTSLGWLSQGHGLEVGREALLFFAVLMGVLMISNIRMFALKFAGFGWRGNELRYSFIALSVVLIGVLGGYAVPLIILLYILLSVGRNMLCRSSKCAKTE